MRTAIVIALLCVLLTACSSAEHEYLTEEIPPCAPVTGASVEPCEQGVEGIVIGSGVRWTGWDAPHPVSFFINGHDVGVGVAHVVVRATYLPNSLRCKGSLGTRLATRLGGGGMGIESGIGLVQCFADVRANAYIVGSGPPTMTVLVGRVWVSDRSATPEQAEEWVQRIERVFRDGGDRYSMHVPEGGVEGRESVLFLHPALDHAYEVWQVATSWYVQRNDDETVVVVHPNRDYWTKEAFRSQLEIPLADFITSVTAAHTARLEAYDGKIFKDSFDPLITNDEQPTLVTDANMLHSYHMETENMAHPAGPPAPPPPACGLAVPDYTTNPGLMADCETLLAVKDTLRGDAALNWSVDVAMADWDGIRTRGTGRVTDIILVDKELTGTVPAELAELTGLQYLWLNLNQLTGAIPPELGSLPAIKSLLLNDNMLTGPIPTELGNLTTLEALWLHSNQLTGPVPSQLAQLSNLQNLTLSSNALTGEIPSGIGSLSGLEILWLSHNQLTGNVPSALGNLSNLQKLNLSNNQLTGAIPTSLGDLADTLTELRMANNPFTGCIPAGLRGVAINDLDRLGLSDCTG